MIHTYYTEFNEYDDNDYNLIAILVKAENKKEAITKLNSRFPLLKLKECHLTKLDKLEIIGFYK